MVELKLINNAIEIVETILKNTIPTQINDAHVSYIVKPDSDSFGFGPVIRIYWTVKIPVEDSTIIRVDSHKFGMSIIVQEYWFDTDEDKEATLTYFTHNVQANMDDFVIRLVKAVITKDFSDVCVEF